MAQRSRQDVQYDPYYGLYGMFLPWPDQYVEVLTKAVENVRSVAKGLGAGVGKETLRAAARAVEQVARKIKDSDESERQEMLLAEKRRQKKIERKKTGANDAKKNKVNKTAKK